MNIFLDESVPQFLQFRLEGNIVQTPVTMDWRGIQNGTLLRLINAAGFDVFITADKNMQHQQQMEHLNFATLVLSTNHSKTVRLGVRAVRDALTSVRPGTISHVDCGEFKPGKRGK